MQDAAARKYSVSKTSEGKAIQRRNAENKRGTIDYPH